MSDQPQQTSSPATDEVSELRVRLAEAEETVRALRQGEADAIVINVEGKIVYVNPAAVRLYGASSARQLLGKPLLEMVDAEYRDFVLKRLQEVKGAGHTGSFETKVLRLDGELVDVEAFASVIRHEGAEAVQVVLRDVTKRRQMIEALWKARHELEARVRDRTAKLTETIRILREEGARRLAAEQALSERSRLLEAFFRHSSTPLVFLDREFNFIRVNEAYARACKRGVDEFPGRNHFELYPNDENKAIFEQVVRSKKAFEVFGKPFVFPDHPEWGTTHWNWRLTPLLDDAGEVEFLVFALEDVTERVKSEQQLQALNQTLRRRTQQLRSLASDLTLAEQRERRRLAQLLHDHLQQLLVGAKFRASPLHHAKDPSVAQTAREIDDLLNQSIAASRSLTAELSPPILHEGGLIVALEWLCGWVHQNQGLQVNCCLDRGAEPQNHNVRVTLFQAVRELLLNIVKHAGVKTARLGVSRAGGQVRVTVWDEGKGFDPSASDPGEGNRGFGLFSIQERLDLLGGGVEIDSAPGRGTRVTLHAPVGEVSEPAAAGAPLPEVQRPEAGPAAAVGEHPQSVDGQRVRVLLVDDHAVTRQGLRRLLKQEPRLEVVGEATDGAGAIERAHRLRPDVVVMDVSMPGMSGIDATRHIHGRFPDIKIIGLSMFAQEERGAEMRQAGACAYFTKSGPPQHLVQAICDLCGPKKGSSSGGSEGSKDRNEPRA